MPTTLSILQEIALSRDDSRLHLYDSEGIVVWQSTAQTGGLYFCTEKPSVKIRCKTKKWYQLRVNKIVNRQKCILSRCVTAPCRKARSNRHPGVQPECGKGITGTEDTGAETHAHVVKSNQSLHMGDRDLELWRIFWGHSLSLKRCTTYFAVAYNIHTNTCLPGMSQTNHSLSSYLKR